MPLLRRRRTLAALLMAVVSLTALAGCGLTRGSDQPPPAALDERLVEANTRFGFDLMRSLWEAKLDENLVISPPSVSLALSLTYNGAAGETQQGMAEALALGELTEGDLNRGNRDLMALLANPDPGVRLEVANSIWYQQGFTVHPDFLTVAREDYGAAVGEVDFASPRAAAAINRWVKEATRGKIPALLDRTDPMDRMYLVNALYFNGTWRNPFDPANTRPRPFHLPDGSTRDHPMMTRSGFFRYLETESFQAAALPYGEGRISFYLFVPKPGASLEELVAALTPQSWAEWMKAFSRRQGTVTMPKVKVEYKAELSETLKAMGMEVAFDPNRADFSRLFTDVRDPLYIALVLHKTYLDVNEKGTEAAAATAVGVRAGSAAPADTPFTLVADRPYLMAIRDDRTGAVLFLGAIADPQG